MATLYDINQEPFFMDSIIEDHDEITVTQTGYIITKNGEFIKINSDENHCDICNKFLTNYLKEDCSCLSSYDSIKKLIRSGNILYVGVRMKDVLYHFNCYNSFIFVPDYAKITMKQYEALELLGKSNYSRSGNQLSKINMCTYDVKKETIPFFDGMDMIKSNLDSNYRR
jgi:hypothetical protein